MQSVQQRRGGGRDAVPSRHGQKGGRRHGGWSGGHGCSLLLQRRDHGRHVGLRNAEPLDQDGQRAGGGIAEGAQCRQQRGQEDVDPLMRFPLEHAEQASLHHLQGGGREGGEEEEEPVFRRRQGAVLVDGKAARGAGCSIEAPRRHMRLERRFKGREQELKLLKRQARQIQKLRPTGRNIDTP